MNLAGFIACNQRNGDAPLASWEELTKNGHVLLDVREPEETHNGTVWGAVLIPLNQLRARWGELPTDRPVDVMCAAGQRAYYAVRLLRQHGVDARLLSGGWQTWKARQSAGLAPSS